ncbi:MAG: GGDEF domain-containing protein [Halofilum sp. (in: g-proteobacteria)]|nr:GGDEF domain-containing protein [Halofilum sp. (in: g-proteobacteria)]
MTEDQEHQATIHPEEHAPGLRELTEPVARPGPASIRAAIERTTVAHLFDQMAMAAVVNVALAALVVLVLEPYPLDYWPYGWVGLLVAVTLGRLYQLRRYRATPEPDPRQWALRYLATMTASGLLWGAAVPLFMPETPPLQDMVLVIAVAGVAAGALPVNAAMPHLYITYLVATLAPAAIMFFVLGGRDYWILATMTVLYGGALATAGHNYSRNLRHAYELSARLNQANRQLAHLASHDVLTGLCNRSRFETTLDRELDRVKRYGSFCSLIMLDIDRFKQINDHHGHDTGDRVLEEIGTLFAEQVRAPDLAARWGGEEFMVLLPQTGLESAEQVAERLRRQVAATDFDGVGTVTISLGVTESRTPEERSVMFKRLDDALYRAKQNGRNRVESAPAPHTEPAL